MSDAEAAEVRRWLDKLAARGAHVRPSGDTDHPLRLSPTHLIPQADRAFAIEHRDAIVAALTPPAPAARVNERESQRPAAAAERAIERQAARIASMSPEELASEDVLGDVAPGSGLGRIGGAAPSWLEVMAPRVAREVAQEVASRGRDGSTSPTTGQQALDALMRANGVHVDSWRRGLTGELDERGTCMSDFDPFEWKEE